MPKNKSAQLPARISKTNGTLVTIGSTSSAQLALRDTKSGRIFRLNDGDHILLGDKLVLVKHEYCGRDRLNGYLGFYIKGPNNSELRQTQQMFLFCVPSKGDDLSTLSEAYFNQTEVTIKFATKPLAEKNNCFVSGNLFTFYEQGMVQILPSVQDREHAGYDGLNPIEVGDLLTVYNAKGTHVVWQGRFTQKRRELLLESYYKRKKPSPVIETLLQAFALDLPVLLKKAKKA